MVSFAVQKLVSLIRSHLFIFASISIAWGDWLKKTLVGFMSECFAYVLYDFYDIIYLLFQSLSRFEFILLYGVYDVRVYSNVTDLHAVVQLTNHHLLKRLYFFLLYIFASYVKDQLTVSMWIILGSLFCPIDPYVHISNCANCCCCCLVAKSCLTLVTPWTVAHHAPLSMGFLR